METATASIDLPRALQAMRALLRDPDDTKHVFTIIESLTGRSRFIMQRRFASHATGARLLRDKPAIVPLLRDRDALRRLPENSLGRAYLAFVESEGISADGLVGASKDGETPDRVLPDDLQFIHERMRDTHDLWHTVTGYKGDTIGEVSLLAFTLPHTLNPGIAFIVLAAMSQRRSRGKRRTVLDGFRRGLKAAWLPAVDWEALLPLPLDEVRRQLRLGPPPVYTPIRTSDLRAQGLLQ